VKKILVLALIGTLVTATYFGYSTYVLGEFESANEHYANNEYQLAADKYLYVLDSLIPLKEHETAAYLLTTILRSILSQSEMQKFIENHPRIHPYFSEIFTRWRSKQGPIQARVATLYLQRVNLKQSRAHQRLISYVDSRLPSLQTQDTHGLAWITTLTDIVDIASDPHGNLWAMTIQPARILRFDLFGDVVEVITFQLPDEVTANQDVNFNVFKDGSFLIANTKFNKQGKKVQYEEFDHRLEDISLTKNNELLVLLSDGIKGFNAGLKKTWERISPGSKPQSFNTTRAIASNDKQIIVLSWYRLQLLNLKGELQTHVEGKFSWAWDVTIDNNGFVYLGSVNGKRIDVYNNKLEKISSLKVGSDHLAVANNNLLYAMDRGVLTALYPHKDIKNINKMATVAKPQKTQQATKIKSTAIKFTSKVMEQYPHITVHNNTDYIADVSVTNDDGETFWLATYGGLVRFQPATTQWQKWTSADGLPHATTQRVVADENYIWMKSGSDFARFNIKKQIVETIEPATRRAFNIRDILPDDKNPDVLWLLAQEKLIRYSKSSNTGEVLLEVDAKAFTMRLSKRQNALIIASYSRIWQLDLSTNTLKTIIDIENITSQASRPQHLKRDSWFGSITIDEQRNGFWIGMYYDRDIFFYDFNAGSFNAVTLDPTLLQSCGRSAARIQLFGNDVYYFGPQCIAKRNVDDNGWNLIVRTPNLYKGSLIKVDDGNSLWYASQGGLYKIVDNTMNRVRPPWQETSENGRDLLKVGSSLWMAGSAINIYDTNTKKWKQIPNISAKRLRYIDDRVIALSRNGLYSIDPETHQAREFRPGNQRWASLNDLMFDGNTWWAVGGKNERDKSGIRAWNGTEEKRWTRADGMPFHTAEYMLQDACEPDVIWLSSQEGLIRFSKQQKKAEIIQAGNMSHIEIHQDKLYALSANTLYTWDCETQKLESRKISNATNFDLLPEGLAWRHFYSRSKELRSLLKIRPTFVTNVIITENNSDKRVWISTHDGLLEMQLPAGPSQ